MVWGIGVGFGGKVFVHKCVLRFAFSMPGGDFLGSAVDEKDYNKV